MQFFEKESTVVHASRQYIFDFARCKDLALRVSSDLNWTILIKSKPISQSEIRINKNTRRSVGTTFKFQETDKEGRDKQNLNASKLMVCELSQ